ncbi:MAG: hypothetical protein GEU83_03155 [Pseudonocardiaceae bacterium]|nr:hypothetical protein [Pseudonocardiaceae bacterium]
MMSYRDAAAALWGEAGMYAHDGYACFRAEHFAELPEQLPIVIGITAYGRCLGLTRAGWEHGPRITLASNLFRAGRGHVDDTLLHEMLHAWLHETGQDTGHDSEAWYAAVRRLSPAVLGHELDARRGAGRRSVRVPNPNAGQEGQPATVVRKVAVTEMVQHSDVARWPSPFRPTDHDFGAPINCPTY